jgi:hypothetical protein
MENIKVEDNKLEVILEDNILEVIVEDNKLEVIVEDNKLQLILNKYNTKKNSKYNNYGKYYEKYLNNYINKQIRYLEIGVSRGESLFAMCEYFGDAKVIAGIDINPYSITIEDKKKKIFVEIGKQNNELFLKKVNDKYGSFDVIIDDGSHELDDILVSFNTLFPLLNDKGVYIIENTVNIRDYLYFFHNLVRYKNKTTNDYCEDGSRNASVDPEKINMKTDNILEYSLGDIIFTNAAIIIYKDIKHHWINTDTDTNINTNNI